MKSHVRTKARRDYIKEGSDIGRKHKLIAEARGTNGSLFSYRTENRITIKYPSVVFPPTVYHKIEKDTYTVQYT